MGGRKTSALCAYKKTRYSGENAISQSHYANLPKRRLAGFFYAIRNKHVLTSRCRGRL